MEYFDARPQRFYLLSLKKRTLFYFHSDDQSIEEEVEQAFSRIKPRLGGNVYAVYRYEPSMLAVMMELADRLGEKYPNLKGLSGYLRQLEEGDIFIRHQAWAPLCDLKRSMEQLHALAKGLDEQQMDNRFVLTWGRLYLMFDTYSYGFLTDKIRVGEPDRNKRKCRFCEKMGHDKFAHESHAIMEGLGNDTLFCYEECDDCNQNFESDVEKHLFKFLEICRTLYNVSGKGSRSHHLEGENFHIHPDANHKPVVYVKQEKILNDVYKGSVTGKIWLFNKGQISMQGIYKALVKIAVDMMPVEVFEHCKNAGKWVHGDVENGNLPFFLYGEHERFFEHPVIDLFVKNDKSPQYSPY